MKNSPLLLIFALAIAQATAAPRATLLRNNSAVGSFPTIQEAVNAAKSGDIIRISPGIHHEVLTVAGDHTAGGTVTIDGAGATLDGADAGLQTAPNTRWTLIGGGVYEAEVAWAGPLEKSQVTWVTPTSGSILAAYHKEELWTAMARGPGTMRNGTKLRLRPGDLGDPNLLSLSAGISEAVIKFENARGWILKDITLLHGGTTGILIGKSCQDILIEHVTCRDSFRGISTEFKPSEIKILNCTVTNRWNDDWAWREGYKDGEKASDDFNGPMRGTGMDFYGSNAEIAHNQIHGQWDGMGIRGNHIDAHHNTISGCHDDGVELECGASSEIRFHDNLIYDVFDAISTVSNQPGPIYIYRNRLSANRLNVFDPSGNRAARFGYGLKMGNDWGIGASRVYFYQNTFYDKRMNLWDKGKTPWKDFRFLNNIFVSEGLRDMTGETERYAIFHTGLAADGCYWNGNLYFRPGHQGILFKNWNGTGDVATLAEAQKLYPAWETHGQQADPRFIRLDASVGAGNEFLLSADSPARDHAVPLPDNWPDSVIAKDGRPDIGAMEYEPSSVQP